MHSRRSAWLLGGALLGCGPVVLPGDGGGEGDGDGSDGSASGTTSGATTATTVTSGPSTFTSGPSSSATNTDDADDDVMDEGPDWDCGAAPPGTEHHCIGGTPDSVCDPQPMEAVAAWVVVDGGALPMDPVPEPYVYACTIAGSIEGAGFHTLELACDDGPHTLEIGTSVGIWFDQTGDFVLSVIQSQSTFRGTDVLVTLRRADGELVLAGATTPWPPDLDAVPADFFDPLAITLLAEVCPLEPPPPGGNFIDTCYTVQRQALRFELQGRARDVYDHGVDQLSPYVLLVQHAEQRHDVTCSDISDRWYSWVAVPPIPD